MALESVVGSVISKIAELMVEPVGRQFRYMFCFNHFVEEFNERKQNLALALDDLQKDVEAAEWNAEEIKKRVKKWMEDANNEIEGAKPLENGIGKNGKCFTWCPNCMRQFKLSKVLAKKSETFRNLLETKFTKVGHKAPPPIEFLPSKDFTLSESSKEAFEQIMKALKDDNAKMIGLYGMGGVGKTTLVKEVGRATELQLFDVVLMATVSQNPNVKDIQHELEDKLGLDIKEKSNTGRAARLRQRLKKVEKMLIILDDVWKHIDLEAIGIPFGDDHMGCKILLTTRHQGICSSMECQQKVFLRELPEDEAWDLFKINTGLPDGDATLNEVAREVARECQGLPIALVTVGRALRGKSQLQWEVASKQLKESQFVRMEQIDEQNNVYTCLKLSYDYLKYEETKSCFLLCCLFPEDYNIPIEDLTRCAVGYAEPIEDARKRVSVAIEELKDCCMLLGTETEEHVKMHDLVRDFAIQIASSKYGFMVKAGIGLKEWPFHDKSFEGCTTISLMGNKLAELPEGLECPKLKVLLLELDDGMNVPERFFEGMREIEVLSLKGGCLSLQSLELSTKLQSLVLISCGCKDLIWLRKLQRLKILVFQWCSSIEELPDEIGELKELRLLDVTGCYNLRRIPVNLIGRLKKLEELLIGQYSFQGWDVVGWDSTGGMNASLTELNSLSQLAVLSLRIPKVECIPRDFVFPVSLRKYLIKLGNANEYVRIFGITFAREERYPTSTRLILDGTSFNAKIFEQLFLHKLESVEVRDCGDVFTLFPARLRQGLKNLKEVIVNSCKSLEEVFELGEADEGSSYSCQSYPSSSIWKGPTGHVSLQSLVVLKLRSLDKLTFIFTTSLAQSLAKLERLEISDCGELKHIIREEDGEREIIPESPRFPQLKEIFIQGCGKLENVFPVSVSPSLLNLEEMMIDGADNLKQIFYSGEGDALPTDGIIKFSRLRELSLSNGSFFGPKNFAAQLPSLQYLEIDGNKELGNLSAQLQGLTNLETLYLKSLPYMRCIWKGLMLSKLTTFEQNGFLQRLESVHLDDCGDVRAPFPAKLLRALKNLDSVKIEDCKSLEEVFELGEEKELPLLSSLTTLELSRLRELKCIWKGPTRNVSLENLVHLKVSYLNKLTFIFTPSLAQSLPKLERLEIRDCHELKHIIREEDGERKIIPESPRFPKLKKIFIQDCGKLEYVFPVSVSPSLPNLEEMRIDRADNLKQIFYSGEGDALPTDGIIKFPRLSKLSLSNCSFFGPNNFAAQLPSLEYLKIDGHKELENLSAQLQGLTNLETLSLKSLPDMRCIWKGLVLRKLTTLEMAAPGEQNGSLQRLECVQVNECGDVTAKFLQINLKTLKEVIVDSCESLEELFELGECGEGSSEEKELLSSLTELQLSKLPELKCIWKGPTGHVSLQSLVVLKLYSLDKLTFIFTTSLAQSLPKLERLSISRCGELKHIIREEDGEREIITESPCFPQLKEIFIEGCDKLETLEIQHCGELKHIIREEDGEREIIPESPRFPKLETLIIEDCGKLEYVFPVSVSLTLQSLPQLERLDIRDCGELKIDGADNLKQILYSGEGDALPTDGIIKFPRLRYLSLSNCRFFGPKNFAAQLPSLQYLKIDGHKELGNLSAQLQGLTNLKALCLKSLPDMRCIWKGVVLSKLTTLEQNDFLQRLESVHVVDCGDVCAPFPTKLLQALKNLKSVEIKDCKSLEEVFELGEADEGSSEEKELPLLSSLTALRLSKLPQLKCILKGPTGHVSLQSLARLYLQSLDKLTFIFTPSLAQSLPKLERLEIGDCHELKHIIREEDGEREIIPESPSFPQLKTLYISLCFSLEYVFPVSMSPSLTNLEQMTIDRADNLKQIFYGGEGDALPRDGIIKFPELRELKHIIIEEDGEREIIQESPGLPKLKTIIIKECGKLEHVFPVSVSPSLLNLEKMQISDADNLKQIFYSGEGDALTTYGIIKFPRLSELDLSSRSNYSFFGPKNFAAQLRNLQILEIDGHKEFGNLFAQLQQNDILQRLEIVRVKDCGDVRAPFPTKLLQALKNLWGVEIEDCKSLEEVFELGELPDEGRSEEKELLSSLTDLRLLGLPELKCIWKGPTRNVSLQSLAHLKLDYLDKLTFIFTLSLAQSLPKLERLEIRDCGELKHIIREEDGEREIIPCFPKLKTIIISFCFSLEYVFPVSMSPSLTNLEQMTIDRADNLKQIFYGGEGDVLPRDGIFKFPRLSELSLRFRSNYIFLGPTNFDAQLPLQQLTIIGHEEVGNWLAQLQMAIHGQQNGFLQKLEIIRVDDCGDVRTPFPAKLLRALKNLNGVTVDSCKSLEEVFELDELPDEGRSEEKELLSSLTELQLQRLPELKCIWKGPTRHLSLQSLAYLKLDYLDKLTFIFTPSLAQSLRKLERLEISKCGELKHIIREEDGEREIIPESPCFPELKIIAKDDDENDHILLGDHLQSLWFPNLCEIEIRECNKLKSLFPAVMASGLPKLQIVRVTKSSQLFGVFGQDDQASPVNVEKEMVLPNLEELSLEQLSSIVCFSFGWCDYFLFPRLEKLKVHQCPKLTTKFAITPDGSMSAQSEVSEVAEDSSINREWTRDNGWEEEEEEEEEDGTDDDDW